jgi:membrane associated rhomboid family serine protease
VCAIPGGAAAGPARAVVVNVGAARPAGGLGIASLVMGILACLTAWIPLLGMIALPVAALGLLFGLLGAMISLIGRRSAAGLALAGVVICIAAIALQVAVTSAATRAGMDLLPATMPADIEP